MLYSVLYVPGIYIYSREIHIPALNAYIIAPTDGPRDIRVVTVTSHDALLTWRSPRKSSGRIVEYEVITQVLPGWSVSVKGVADCSLFIRQCRNGVYFILVKIVAIKFSRTCTCICLFVYVLSHLPRHGVLKCACCVCHAGRDGGGGGGVGAGLATPALVPHLAARGLHTVRGHSGSVESARLHVVSAAALQNAHVS